MTRRTKTKENGETSHNRGEAGSSGECRLSSWRFREGLMIYKARESGTGGCDFLDFRLLNGHF